MAYDAAAKPKTCIIGAGCSGFTMAKRLKDAGLPYDCFEKSDNIGGNWYYNNPNGVSSCYQSLHIDTSKWRLAFEDYPVPADWPDFPHHAQLLQYFHDYVDHFGLRETITFNTSVTDVADLPGGRYRVTLSTGETRDYDAVCVANGHHWDARTPTYPGNFTGYQVHSHHYRDPFEPYDFRGKRIRTYGVALPALVEALGGIPTSFVDVEMYEALSNNILDCTATDIGFVEAFQLYDVASYFIDVPLGANWGQIIGMNLDTYNALSEEHQAVLEELKYEHLEELLALFEAEEERIKARWEAEGLVEIVDFPDDVFLETAFASAGVQAARDSWIQRVMASGMPEEDAQRVIDDINQ